VDIKEKPRKQIHEVKDVHTTAVFLWCESRRKIFFVSIQLHKVCILSAKSIAGSAQQAVAAENHSASKSVATPAAVFCQK
jgi:hypothetical protein